MLTIILANFFVPPGHATAQLQAHWKSLQTDVVLRVDSTDLVPMRTVVEGLNGEVYWNEMTRTVTAFYGGNSALIAIDSATAHINGSERNLDVPARIVRGRSIVPGVFLCEMLSARCKRDDTTQTLIFTVPVQSGKRVSPDAILRRVIAYADHMLTYGRDHYGPVRSPLFASTLDRKDLRLAKTEPPNIEGIRSHDRVLTGANPMHDENFYRLLTALTKISGNPKYEQSADAALKWFFEHTTAETGLFAWGEHLGWDFTSESVVAGRDIHEFYRPWLLWDKCFSLAFTFCNAFARGLWENQIANSKTGNFSRHAHYRHRGPEENYEFPRHAGFYIATWANAYARTGDVQLLHAIETLVSYFERRRHPTTGAFPSASAHPGFAWPFSDLSMAIDLWAAAAMVPEDLGIKMRMAAQRTDSMFARVPHELQHGGRGMVILAQTDTLQPGQIDGRPAFSQLWSAEYGQGNDATYAMTVWERYRQSRLAIFKNIVLATAERYLAANPPAGMTLYPGSFGSTISLLLRAYSLTQDNRFLSRADELASEAIDVFWGNNPLPRASSNHEHYETITGADTLAVALLELWSQHTAETPLQFEWVDR